MLKFINFLKPIIKYSFFIFITAFLLLINLQFLLSFDEAILKIIDWGNSLLGITYMFYLLISQKIIFISFLTLSSTFILYVFLSFTFNNRFLKEDHEYLKILIKKLVTKRPYLYALIAILLLESIVFTTSFRNVIDILKL